tara:strand:+ start:219 stop:587 length:369 start_codon:yes stop_codon:yes gene_type:complete
MGHARNIGSVSLGKVSIKDSGRNGAASPRSERLPIYATSYAELTSSSNSTSALRLEAVFIRFACSNEFAEEQMVMTYATTHRDRRLPPSASWADGIASSIYLFSSLRYDFRSCLQDDWLPPS